MALPTNNKKADNLNNKNQKNQGKGSKFIKSGSKPAGPAKKSDLQELTAVVSFPVLKK